MKLLVNFSLNISRAKAGLLAGSAIYAAASLGLPALADVSPFAGLGKDENEPVMLQAEQLDYDNATKMVIAQGKVEVSQGGTILMADTLTYDQRNDIVFAQGNVSVLEPSGTVYFAEEVELSDQMSQGVVKELRSRMTDNSLFAANSADRVSDDVTVMHQAVYSPCSVLCDDGSEKAPLWQVRADKATIDRKEQEVTYRNATMDIYGVPVLYTPYLSHVLPGAESRSGFLAPQYQNDNNLGNVFKIPYYWAISPDQDATTTLMYASLEAPVLIGQYRRLWDFGSMTLDGSVTRPDDRDALGTPDKGKTTRGHFFGNGQFELSDAWQAGFNIRRTTDDTYLRRYDFNNDPLLTSRIYSEGFDFAGSGRSYARAQGLSFQGLQQQDDKRKSPLVLPVVDAFYQSEPMAWNSRFTVSGGAMSLSRDLGADSRRVSFTGAWELPYVTDNGQIWEFSSSLRADAYDVQDFTLPGGTVYDGQQTRVIPQASVTWHYPLVNRFDSSSLVIEPIAGVTISPTGGNSFKIPNEDSAVPEFTDTNLFSDNRFAGYDRVETGPRMNYGIRSQWMLEGGKTAYALLGQAYRTNDDPLFPISNDLSSRFSDYVGHVGLSILPFDVNYRFRVDKDTFELKRNEVMGSMAYSRFSYSVTYLSLNGDPVLSDKEDLSTAGSIRLNDRWLWLASINRDLLRDKFVSANTGLVFQNECVTLQTLLGRNYTSDRDFKESTSITMQLLLKNLN